MQKYRPSPVNWMGARKKKVERRRRLTGHDAASGQQKRGTASHTVWAKEHAHTATGSIGLGAFASIDAASLLSGMPKCPDFDFL